MDDLIRLTVKLKRPTPASVRLTRMPMPLVSDLIVQKRIQKGEPLTPYMQEIAQKLQPK